MLTSFIVKAGDYCQLLINELLITDFQAAAIMGNIGFLSNGAQANYRNDGSYGPAWAKGTIRRGYGWAQWENTESSSRLDGFIDFVTANFSVDITTQSATDKQNYLFLLNELTEGEKRSCITGGIAGTVGLQNTSDIYQAVTDFMNSFDQPLQVNMHLDRRINYAYQALQSLNRSNVPLRSTGKNLSAGIIY